MKSDIHFLQYKMHPVQCRLEDRKGPGANMDALNIYPVIKMRKKKISPAFSLPRLLYKQLCFLVYGSNFRKTSTRKERETKSKR